MAHSESPYFARRDRRRCGACIRALAVVSVVAVSGCTELASGNDRLPQEFRQNQPDDAGAGPDTRWGCLDQPIATAAAPLAPAVELTLRIIDTVTGAPPPGLVARACDRQDVSCETPLTPESSNAADGALHISVQQQFDGFIELRSPTTVPTMYFINQALIRDTAESFAIVSTRALAGLAAGGNVMLDPALGHVLIRTFDCQGSPASGVQLSNNRGGQVFSFVRGLPEVGRDATSGDGIGGFVNVPLDYVVLQGIVVEHGNLLGEASVTVRAGWFSYGDIEPLPE